ncbi:MAG: helix-turn-helix domain-containing protein [Patescibacteria group bacterium]
MSLRETDIQSHPEFVYPNGIFHAQEILVPPQKTSVDQSEKISKIDFVVRLVCHELAVDPVKLSFSGKSSPLISDAKSTIGYLLTNRSVPQIQIAPSLGIKSTSVGGAVRRFFRRKREDEGFRDKADKIMEETAKVWPIKESGLLKVPKIRRTFEIIEEQYSLPREDLIGGIGNTYITEARSVLSYLLQSELDLKLESIGSVLGDRNHSTITHLLQRIKWRISLYPDFGEVVEQLGRDLKLEENGTSG